MPDTGIRIDFCGQSLLSWAANSNCTPSHRADRCSVSKTGNWELVSDGKKIINQSGIFGALPELSARCAVPCAGTEDAVPADQTFVNRFWQADSEAARMALSEQLLVSQPDPAALFELLKVGPLYSDKVPLGEHVLARTNSAGTEFPYMINIPQDYDPQRKWPVEFVLHGGVGRPKAAAGENFWQRSMERIGQPGRITVVPLAWPEAVWWQDEQADNLVAILNRLKSTYNVDENQVSLTGISDGGTGAYFYAFKQPTQWASFLPYIGHPGVLRNPQSGGGYRLYFENLMNKPLYIVNGENDRLYPAASLSSFIDILKDVGFLTPGLSLRRVGTTPNGCRIIWMKSKNSNLQIGETLSRVPFSGLQTALTATTGIIGFRLTESMEMNARRFCRWIAAAI